MKKLLLTIVTSTILVTLSILLIASISCKKTATGPRMTAPEVCQYVNQALPNEYQYLSSTMRYEFRYTALSAQFGREIPSDQDLASRIGGLSPSELDLYKEQLREKMKDLSPQNKEAVLARIRGIIELDDIFREFGGVYPDVGEGVWHVKVKVITEPQQRLSEGQWVLHRGSSPQSTIVQYYFPEATGALTKPKQ